MDVLRAVLAFAHVVSAIGWVGGGIMFGFVIAPRLGKLSLPSAREFTVSVVPSVLRFFQIIAGSTVLFGLLLLYDMTRTGAGTLSFDNTWGQAIIVGASIALVAFLYSEFLAVPAFKRLVALNQKMAADGSSVPPELPRAARQAAMASLIATVLVLITVGCMVTAGFY